MYFDPITHDPGVMGGKPCVRGQHVLPENVAPLIVATLRRYEERCQGRASAVRLHRPRTRIPRRHGKPNAIGKCTDAEGSRMQPLAAASQREHIFIERLRAGCDFRARI